LVVTPLEGEVFRVVVHSETNPEEAYIVDLQEHAPLGECSCRDWACRKFPEFKKTGKAYPCKHIISGRGFVLDAIIRASLLDRKKT
jgi:hypothetical protein